VAALKVRLTPSEERDVKERPFDNPVAYDAYLRASHLMYTWTPDSQRRAVRLVDEAIEIAGDVPLLLAMKGQLHWNTVNMSLDPSPTALEEADALAHRALALDPDCYLAIFVRGLVAGTRGQPEIGLVDLYRAHHLRPGDGNVLVEVGRFSLAAGLRRWQATGDQLVAIEPLSPQCHLLVGLYHWLHGPRREAARHASRAIELAPEPSMLHMGAAWCMAAAGLRTEAAAILARVSSAAPDVVAALATFLDCALRLDEAGASRVMTPEIEQAVTNEFFCLMMAQGHALLGRRDAAIRMLRAAIRLGFINYPGLTAEGSYLESLNSNLAFQALLAEVRPRWERVVLWESAGP
jgi:tetratricopeptide (TPR) repeat protein